MMTRRTLSVLTKAAIVAGIFTVTGPYPPAFASPLGITRAAIEADDGMVLEVRFRGGGARVGHSALGNRNVNVNRNVNANRNVNVNRNVSVNRNVVRNRTVVNRNVVRTAWVRPGYRWRPGGAIVAGAAIGF